MSTLKIKTVEEVVAEWGENGHAEPMLRDDRAAIHASLVAAVEELPRQRIFKFGTDVLGEEWYVDEAQVLTIINSIFKE